MFIIKVCLVLVFLIIENVLELLVSPVTADTTSNPSLYVGLLSTIGDRMGLPRGTPKNPEYGIYYSIRMAFDREHFRNTTQLLEGYISSKICPKDDGPISRSETFILTLKYIDSRNRVPQGDEKCPVVALPSREKNETPVEETRVILGPYCPDQLTAALLVTHSFKQPIMHITYGGVDQSVEYFKEYKNFFRTAYNRYDQFKTLIRLCGLNKWTTLCVIYDQNDHAGLADYNALKAQLKSPAFVATFYQMNPENSADDSFVEKDLTKCSKVARVVGLLVRPEMVRKFMLAAYSLRYVDGSYVFFAVDPFALDIVGITGAGYWGNTSSISSIDAGTQSANKEQARQAYASLLILRVSDYNTSVYQKNLALYKAHLKKSISITMCNKTAPNELETFTQLPISQDVNTINSFNAVRILQTALINTYNKTFFRPQENNPGNPLFFVDDGDVPAVGNISAVIQAAKNRFAGPFFIDSFGHIRENYSIMGMTNLVTGEFQQILDYLGINDTWSDQLSTFKFSVQRKFPNNAPACGYDGKICAEVKLKTTMGVAIGIPLFLIAAAICFYFYRQQVEQTKQDKLWIAKASDLKVNRPGTIKPSDATKKLAKKSLRKSRISKTVTHTDSKSFGSEVCSGADKSIDFTTPTKGRWKKTPVMISWSPKHHVRLTDKLIMEVRVVMKLRHENLLKFIGGCLEREKCVILYEYCSRGSLQEMILNTEAKFEWPLRFSFINDLVRGMYYIHSSPLRCHGRLTSACCFIDSRFTLKIADAGLDSYFNLNLSEYWAQKRRPDYYNTLFWLAPEHLRVLSEGYFRVDQESSKEGDVYSFSIILQEVILKNHPYAMVDMDSYRIFIMIKREPSPGGKPFRPVIDEAACHTDMIKLCEKCWAENPADRPSFNQIRVVMKDVVKNLGMGDKLNILETLLAQMEEQNAILEGVIEEKSLLVAKEKERADKLLFSNLPKFYKEALIKGEPIDPMFLDVCSVLMVDIKNFDHLLSVSEAYDTAEFLSDLHKFYTAAGENYDCFVSESLTHQITAVSGLPLRNGIIHARELARLGLTLLFQGKFFVIKHAPQTRIQIKIAIHSGPIIFGVVGREVPCFGLFGDTVAITERILSIEEPYRIRLSAANRNILEAFGSFRTFNAKEIFVKGYGLMKTFHLVGEEGNVDMQVLQKKYMASEETGAAKRVSTTSHVK